MANKYYKLCYSTLDNPGFYYVDGEDVMFSYNLRMGDWYPVGYTYANVSNMLLEVPEDYVLKTLLIGKLRK
jgi:hypothetical protein